MPLFKTTETNVITILEDHHSPPIVAKHMIGKTYTQFLFEAPSGKILATNIIT